MNRDRWLGIELRHFAALEAIARERSFRGAAVSLGYVQSAISRQIAFLEQVTGTRLIERSQGPRPVCLTRAGDLLLAHADDILASITAAKADLDELAHGRGDEVRVGVCHGVPARMLPRALLAFSRRRPDVRVTAAEASTETPLAELVDGGAVDVSLTCLPAEPGPFEVRELVRVPWVLVVAADSEVAGAGTPLTAADIARLPLIVARSGRVGAAIEARLAEQAGPLHVVFRSRGGESAQALVAAGVGAALAPRLAIDEHDPRTTVIDVGNVLPPLPIGLAWHRNRRLGEAVVEFRELVLQLFAPAPARQSASAPARTGTGAAVR